MPFDLLNRKVPEKPFVQQEGYEEEIIKEWFVETQQERRTSVTSETIDEDAALEY